jgi:hypothetical protein
MLSTNVYFLLSSIFYCRLFFIVVYFLLSSIFYCRLFFIVVYFLLSSIFYCRLFFINFYSADFSHPLMLFPIGSLLAIVLF